MKRQSAGKLINELSRAAQCYFKHEFQANNIGHAQLRTLFYIAHNEGNTQKELGEYLHLDKSSITSQLQILEKNGYISRQTSKEDARKQVIFITDKATKLLPTIETVLVSWTETLLDGFSNEERTELFAYLNKMSENARMKLSELQKDNEMKG